ncbi:MAG: CobD/CbiB family protein [Ottowia sp.]|nr:CobD/CbiB family protein [Ottowia sp.]
MTFFSVLIALIFEQRYALTANNRVYQWLRLAAQKVEKNFNAGEPSNGKTAWCIAVLPLALFTASIHYLLLYTYPILVILWDGLIVYLTLGFRQFSHYYSDIHKALTIHDLNRARTVLQTWAHIDTREMNEAELARTTLEYGILAIHRHVFGVFFWFLLPIGPAGAVLYRATQYLAEQWTPQKDKHTYDFGAFTRNLFFWMDWLPIRITALGFAIVGNFEDAIDGWRHHTQRWGNQRTSVLLATAAGALNVSLYPQMPPLGHTAKNELSIHMLSVGISNHTLQSAIGMVWRAMILWMVLLAMLSIAAWIG